MILCITVYTTQCISLSETSALLKFLTGLSDTHKGPISVSYFFTSLKLAAMIARLAPKKSLLASMVDLCSAILEGFKEASLVT